MKNLYILAIFSIILIACTNDLEPTPPDFSSSEQFFSNPENFEAGLNGIYDAIQSSSMYGRMPILLDGISDNAIAHFASVSDIENFGKGTITSDVNNVIQDAYQAPYVVIARACDLINAIENINDYGTLSTEKVANMKAQAEALRALAYQRLVYLFGDVPFYTKTLSIKESIEISRTPRAEVVEFILNQFKEAASKLTTKPLDGVEGRFTKQAALAFYAQTMVYEARLGNKTWEAALNAATEAKAAAETAGAGLVKEGSGTDGLANYNAVFNKNNAGNNEMLFYVRYDFVLDKGADLQEIFSTEAGKLYMSAHKNLADDFYGTDGLPITSPSSIYDATNPNDNRDPRLHSTLITPGSLYSNGNSLELFEGQKTTGNLVTDYAIRKFTTLNNDIELNRGELNIPVMRFAELLLLYAEAENQVNGPTTAAYSVLNSLRNRVKIANVVAGLSKDKFNEEVIHERRVELAFEGKRWFDLVTLEIADKTINGINEGLGRAFIPNKQELFPIPKVETDRNSNLKQNRGY